MKCGKPKMEYYSARKRRGGLAHAIAWMNFEDNAKERNQTQKILYYTTPFT